MRKRRDFVVKVAMVMVMGSGNLIPTTQQTDRATVGNKRKATAVSILLLQTVIELRAIKNNAANADARARCRADFEGT